ncbi:uncharacterized protein LOC134278172 [Saccostrea cucullata]|uniref:uncharacterized protein LOC134278172 n=1 Tax=Saccostrea cuccullata TaxID=36930 RepID=UPI002ED4DB8C
MDHRTSCQDVMRCALCKTAVVQTYCETCHVNLCKPCVGEHISTHPPKPHKIVDSMEVQTTFIYPKCTSHDEEICEIHCNHCDIPVCSSCLVTDKHLGHKYVKILQFREEKVNQIIKDKIEPNEKIYPIHEAIASDVQNRMNSSDISTLLSVPSVDQCRKLPSKIIVSKPKFSAKKLLVDQFCSLTLVPLKSDDEGYLSETTERSPKTESPHLLNKEFLDEPQTVTTIDTGYRYLYNVACLSDEEIWTSGCDTTMKLYSINQGSLLKSITTKSGNVPYDIAVTKSGDLVYTDYDDRTTRMDSSSITYNVE